MESFQGPFVEGGVKISHAFLDGAHRYTVKGVRTHSGRGPAFARKGDMLTCINGTSLADIPPDELAHLLTDGNPKLTVHKATRKKEASEHFPLEKDALHPFKKESGVLCFSMEMSREEDLGKGECGIGGGGGSGEEAEEGGRGEGGEGPAEEANGEGEGEGRGVLVVKLTNASLSVVKGRGCAAGCPVLECQGTGCTFNEVVLVANSSTVTSVPGNTAMFMQDKVQANINLENIHSRTYLRDLCEDNMLYASNNPTEMTIYSYKSTVTNETFRGVPVVLNFTKSESFLKCTKQDNGAILRVEACDKQRLRLICKQDESVLAFLFYMKGTMSGEHQFESALCEGWFIQVLDKEKVLVANPPVPNNEPSFYFVIEK
ncbi:unnamed protein product [Arctogadus glacialis]